MKTIAYSLVFLLAACSKADNVQIPVNTHVDIQIRNKQGADLLNPGTEGTLNTSEIRVFFKTSTGWNEVFDGSLDCPKHMCLRQSGEVYVARLFPNHQSADLVTETKIQWNEQNVDIVKCKPRRDESGSPVSNEKVWYNDELVLPDKMIPNSSNGILIIK